MRLTLFLLIWGQIQFSKSDPIVELPTGQIQGRQDSTAENVTYYAFEKIPYAAPPIGDLRFKEPQLVEPWDGVLETKTLDVACYQLMTFHPEMPPTPTQSEDCLYLNVFTPKLSGGELLPVMVFIHGGGFTGGSAANNPPDLFINKDVILVAINYRLGVFGFISTQDDVIPGNNGLKDQLQALKWVNQNIGLFGGNSSKVTIFGQSAGAGSCAYQTLQEDRGYFQGVIQESGSYLSPGMFQRNSRKIAFGTGAILDPIFVTSEDSQALYELFVNLTADELNNAALEYSTSVTNAWDNFVEVGSLFAPVIEPKNPTAFVTKKMYGLAKAGNLMKVPIMMGFNSEEKIGMIQPDSFVNFVKVLDENLDYIVSADMQITDTENRTEMGRRIRDMYTNGDTFSNNLGMAIRYSSDNFLTRSMGRQGEFHSQIAKVYFYQFSYDGDLGGTSNHYEGAGNVSHGAEMNYLFCSGTTCIDENIAEEDLLARERLITLWTNFAKYQNPTPEPSELLGNITWSAVSADSFQYLDIGEHLELVPGHPKEEYYSKWIELYESLGYDDFDSF